MVALHEYIARLRLAQELSLFEIHDQSYCRLEDRGCGGKEALFTDAHKPCKAQLDKASRLTRIRLGHPPVFTGSAPFLSVLSLR